ncbi:MAG: hypothetical protein ACE5IJ_12045 [Thermoplasmata archaeon]
MVRYGLLEKVKKGQPESVIKPGVHQVLEDDLPSKTKKALVSLMAALRADIEKKEGI